MFTTSKLTRTKFSGKSKSFKLSTMSNIWLVSLVLDRILPTFLYNTFYSNIDRYSKAALQPLVISVWNLSICYA